MDTQTKLTLKPDQYLELWKYFSDDAAKVKDKLWTISIWLFALQGSVLGYISKQLDVITMDFSNSVLVVVIAVLGFILSGYTYRMITSYGEHIRTSWNRTDYLRKQIEGLNEVWKQGYANYTAPENQKENNSKKPYTKTDAIPSFVIRIRWISIGFAIVFGIFFLVAGFNLIL